MSDILRFHCPQCGARHADVAGPFPISVTCSKCRIPMVASPPSISDCKFPIAVEGEAVCARGANQAGCRYCKPDHLEIERLKEVSRVDEQWEEIRIEDVQPGDVARCNGREFPVLDGGNAYPWVIQMEPRITFSHNWIMLEILGFTFHRKVKQPPQSFELTLTNVSIDVSFLPGVAPVTRSNVTLPGVYPCGSRFRVELLDGEDGA